MIVCLVDFVKVREAVKVEMKHDRGCDAWKAKMWGSMMPTMQIERRQGEDFCSWICSRAFCTKKRSIIPL